LPSETNQSGLSGEQRMLAACRLQEVDATPVWFMRQAGRCLAGYRRLRERYDILTLTRTPELATQISLMPVDAFGVDAAVLYADITLPLFGMGVKFTIDPGVGPIVEEPVRDPAAVAALRVVEAEQATPELFETIRAVRRELAGRAAVIGFAGAPYTLASYLVEGRPSKDHARAKGLMYGRPELWHRLMGTLTEVTVRYLRAQVAAGVQVVQLFDSWMGDLGRREYAEYVLPHSRRIFEGLADAGVPRIHFGTGTAGLLEQMAAAGCDLVSVDWRVPLDEAWARVGPGLGVQGNLDPAVLLAPMPVVEREARRVLAEAGGRPGHVFNLGHGVLPDTPAEHLTALVELVHTASARAPRQRQPAPTPEVRGPASRQPDSRAATAPLVEPSAPTGPQAATAPLVEPSGRPVGVLLMTYGSAVTADDVPAYLRSVYRGKDADPELVAEFQRRYRVVGRSPLIDRTREQGAALQALLAAEHGAGGHLVEVGMLHSAPWIDEAVARLADAGVGRLVGIVLAPQFSSVIMGGYGRALEQAAARLRPDAIVTLAGPWHRTPAFLDCLARRVTEALARLAAAGEPGVPVIFTAHSLPKAVVDRDPAYLDQLAETCEELASRAGLDAGRWQFAYQSAGHTPEEWLKPDLKDLLPGLRAEGHRAVLVVPLQFLADHLEILYDIDVAARGEAEAAGLAFHRIELPNADPLLVRALADVVAREEAAAPTAQPG
jgi:uroporphyrinogen decarboxylase